MRALRFILLGAVAIAGLTLDPHASLIEGRPTVSSAQAKRHHHRRRPHKHRRRHGARRHRK
jgi:hypothetical protein